MSGNHRRGIPDDALCWVCECVWQVFHPFWLVLHIAQGSYWLPMLFNWHTHTQKSIIHPNSNEYVVRSQWRSSLPLHRMCVGDVFTAISLVRDVSGEISHKKAHTASKQHDFSFNFATHFTFRNDVRGLCSGSFYSACAFPLYLPRFGVLQNRTKMWYVFAEWRMRR